ERLLPRPPRSRGTRARAGPAETQGEHPRQRKLPPRSPERLMCRVLLEAHSCNTTRPAASSRTTVNLCLHPHCLLSPDGPFPNRKSVARREETEAQPVRIGPAATTRRARGIATLRLVSDPTQFVRPHGRVHLVLPPVHHHPNAPGPEAPRRQPTK